MPRRTAIAARCTVLGLEATFAMEVSACPVDGRASSTSPRRPTTLLATVDLRRACDPHATAVCSQPSGGSKGASNTFVDRHASLALEILEETVAHGCNSDLTQLEPTLRVRSAVSTLVLRGYSGRLDDVRSRKVTRRDELGALRSSYRGHASAGIRIGGPLLAIGSVLMALALYRMANQTVDDRITGAANTTLLCAAIPFLGGMLVSLLAMRHRRQQLELHEHGFWHRPSGGPDLCVLYSEITRVDLKRVRSRRGLISFDRLLVDLRDGRTLRLTSLQRIEHIASQLQAELPRRVA